MGGVAPSAWPMAPPRVHTSVTRLGSATRPVAESLLGKISDAQATLVNQMAAKPISLEDKSDEDLKMIGVSSIDSLFSKIKIDEKGTEEESTLARGVPIIWRVKTLLKKLIKVGLERSKL